MRKISRLGLKKFYDYQSKGLILKHVEYET